MDVLLSSSTLQSVRNGLIGSTVSISKRNNTHLIVNLQGADTGAAVSEFEQPFFFFFEGIIFLTNHLR